MFDRNERVQQDDQGELPIAKNEDVEFSDELADSDDRIAQRRAAAADRRAEQD